MTGSSSQTRHMTWQHTHQGNWRPLGEVGRVEVDLVPWHVFPDVTVFVFDGKAPVPVDLRDRSFIPMGLVVVKRFDLVPDVQHACEAVGGAVEWLVRACSDRETVIPGTAILELL